MHIETTINIEKKLLFQLNEVSESFNISKSKLLCMLMQEFTQDPMCKPAVYCRVKHQKKSDKKIWHKLHVSFREDFYEKALDLRKLCKLSVSFLCALAIRKFLQKLINKLNGDKDTDNYISQYVIFTEFFHNKYSYTVFNYIPDPKTLEKHLNRT